MDNESLLTIKKLLEELLSKPDGVVVAACITVGGMLGVAFLTAIVQWVVTRTVIRSEHNRAQVQLKSEFRLRQYENWQQRFQELIGELLSATDPEINPNMNRENVVPMIQKSQLMLNLDLESHRKVNQLINELGLAVNGWTQDHDISQILRLHGNLLEAARDTFYLPGHK